MKGAHGMTPTNKQQTERVGSDSVPAAQAATEARLDAALAATFPASDPVAITVREPPRRPRSDGEPRATGDPR
jgi:hypothetical protein